ncbi:hypothetical protein [Aromatoleum aromaticum]|uniref:hypothetical protein n=1 Tax=Aromatoleum aromaticum TaxID=551760 RepID=UPI001459A2DE|nr:hypothetical protein [Aromatoleum aromaticum]NMG56495.1 hypothetical protein [Aromatoleum aromaticum]
MTRAKIGWVSLPGFIVSAMGNMAIMSALAFVSFAEASQIIGEVIGIADGDTLTLLGNP